MSSFWSQVTRMKMFQQPSKLLKFVAAIVLVQVLLAEPLHGRCRKPSSPTPCGPTPLESSQIGQIKEARDFIARLRANKTFAYRNQLPIVTFTRDQRARILEVYRGFGRNQPVYRDLLWEEAASTSTTNTTTPFPRRKRRSTVVTGQSICPVQNIKEILITAFNTDNQPLQIVQFEGFEQWVLRQTCQTQLSPQGVLSKGGLLVDTMFNIDCQTIQRSVYLVAIRLDGEVTLADIDVQEVQVESCSSFEGDINVP